MKQEKNIFREVDSYLAGVMSTDKEADFLKRLEKDVDLQREVDLHKMINNSLSEERESIELESQLNNIYNDVYKPMSKLISFASFYKPTFIRIAGVAAIAIIVFLVGIQVLDKNESNNEIFAEYYKPAEMNMSFRNSENSVDNNLRKAMLFYEQHNYREAISLFEEILSIDNSRIGLNLYSGISNMEIQEYRKANENFQEIIDHQANAFIESAEWYLGLCYLMTSEHEKAEEVFNIIVFKEGYYKKDAKKILRRMN